MKKGLVKWTYFKTNKQKKAVSANKRNIFLKKVIKYVLSHPMSLAGIWEVILNLCKFNSFPPVMSETGHFTESDCLDLPLPKDFSSHLKLF